MPTDDPRRSEIESELARLIATDHKAADAKAFAVVRDRIMGLYVFAEPLPAFGWSDGPRRQVEVVDSLDDAMLRLAEAIKDNIDTMFNEEPSAFTAVA